MNAILVFKIIHIIGFVAWFAGLFYLVRIFVYHSEALLKNDPEKTILANQFQLMEWRVYKIICNPAMMITWTFGILMIVFYGLDWFKVNYWLHTKLVLLIGLTIYHLYSKRIIKRFEENNMSTSSFSFRLFNEVPTIFLILIVSLAIFKNAINYLILIGSIIGLGGLMFFIAKLYKASRESKNN